MHNDRVIAVGDDGTEVDISSIVTAWHEHNVVGEARTLELIVLCSHVVQREHDNQIVVTGYVDKEAK